MAQGGWPSALGADETDRILQALSGAGGDEEDALPRGMAGMTITTVAAAATTPCACPISAYLRLSKLLLNPAALVDKVYVADIKIGTISLNIGSAPIPAVAFARDAIGTHLEAAVWASPSVAPVIYMSNQTAAGIEFAGGLFGRVSLGRPSGAVAS
jgi:hypothetical protein